MSAPAHGSLNVPVGGTVGSDGAVTYTPAAGYTGADAFTFAAITSSGVTADFPISPSSATASLQMGSAPPATPSVAISGAPASLVVDPSVQLSATVANAAQGVSWTTTGGTISPAGLLKAPSAVPAGGTITVRATSTAAPTKFAEVKIAVQRAPTPRPAPRTPGSGPSIPGAPGSVTGDNRLFTGISLKRKGHTILVRSTAMAGGTSNIAAIRGGKVIARCTFTRKAAGKVACKLEFPARFTGKPVRVVLGLRTTEGLRDTTRLLSKGQLRRLRRPGDGPAGAVRSP